MRHVVVAAFIAAVLSAISVHYAEEAMQPFVDAVRVQIYGEPPHAGALLGCDSIVGTRDWIHPTTLVLTVYGDAVAILEDRFGPHGTVEVLPYYAEVERGKQELRCVADYLLEAGARTSLDGHEIMAFPFNITYPRYGLQAGWVSGLTQGLVGHVFIAAYLAWGDVHYLEAARKTGRLLAVAVERGGTRVEFPDGSAWYAEYAQRGVEPPLVLNGHLLALDFLYWMKQLDDDYDWEGMFDAGLRAAVDQVQNYVGSVWSYYDQENNLVTRKYQAFHSRQLDRYSIHDPTGVLDRAGKRLTWQLYVPLAIFQRLATKPSRMLVFLTALFFIVYFPVAWFLTRTQTGVPKDDRDATT